MNAPRPTTFSLVAPVGRGIGVLRRRPLATVLPVLVLLLPLLAVAAGIRFVLRDGGSTALLGLLAGAPRGTPNALILAPDAFGYRMLVALAGLLVIGLALVFAAGLAGAGPGAQDAAADARGGARAAVAAAWRAWPALALVLIGQFLLLALAAGGVVALAIVAGDLRFQLRSVVLVLGLGALAVVALRLSLWPTIALEEGLGPIAAPVEAWRRTRGTAVRVVAALLGVILAVAVPVYLFRLLVGYLLERLERAELLVLSPVAIDLWALALVPVAVVVGVALWAVAARDLVAAVGRPEAPPSRARLGRLRALSRRFGVRRVGRAERA